MLGKQHPGLIDAAISNIVQMPDSESGEQLASSGLTGAFLPSTGLEAFKYQIDIDGNTNSWPGLFKKLLSASPVLKVASPQDYRQWYYDRLRPWVNHVPVESDMSDLPEKVRWLRSHDSVARRIGQCGRELALSLDWETELQRTVPTIAAAFRHFAGNPEVSLCFGAGSAGNECLGGSWSHVEEECAWALGHESRIVVPRPATTGDDRLAIDMAPCPAVRSALVTIAVKREIVRKVSVDERQVVDCYLSRRLLAHADRIEIALLLPNAVSIASAAAPLDERVVSVRIYGLTLSRITTSNASISPRISAAARGADTTAATSLTTPAVSGRVTRQAAVMRTLHRQDIWRGFVPRGPEEESVDGWNGRYRPFKRFLEQAPGKVFIDVGVWKGQSTIFVAEMMREAGMDGCVISVDTFLGSIEHCIGERRFFFRDHGRPDLYETFLDNVFHRNLTHLVVPLPQTSLNAAAILKKRKISAAVVHLDASHEYEDTLRDAQAYWPLVEPGGYLVGDDYHPSWPGVVRAADEFSTSLDLELEVVKPKWILRKPS
jgi:hypothetical protein